MAERRPVAVGWFGGNCGQCRSCRKGELVNCANLQIPGPAYPGGYADSVVVPVSALVRIPDALTAIEAAPLSCAGVAVFNALRIGPARSGDLVAVLGLGGLGHLAVQFAAAMGFDTVVIARGTANRDSAMGFGARHYIDSLTEDVAARLQQLGGPPRSSGPPPAPWRCRPPSTVWPPAATSRSSAPNRTR